MITTILGATMALLGLCGLIAATLRSGPPSAIAHVHHTDTAARVKRRLMGVGTILDVVSTTSTQHSREDVTFTVNGANPQHRTLRPGDLLAICVNGPCEVIYTHVEDGTVVGSTRGIYLVDSAGPEILLSSSIVVRHD